MNLRNICLIFAALALACLPTFVAADSYRPPKFDSLEIFFVGWDVATVTRIDLADARQVRVMYIETSDGVMINRVLKELDSLSCRNKSGAAKGMNLRIVLDFYIGKKLSRTYMGTEDELSELGSDKLCAISSDLVDALHIMKKPGA